MLPTPVYSVSPVDNGATAVATALQISTLFLLLSLGMGLPLAAHVSYLGLVGTVCLQLGFCSATNTSASLLSMFHRVCTHFRFEQDIAAQAADFLDDQGALEQLCKHVSQWLFKKPAVTGSYNQDSNEAWARAQCGDRAQVRSSASARHVCAHHWHQLLQIRCNAV